MLDLFYATVNVNQSAPTLKPESVQLHRGSSYGYLLNMLHTCSQSQKMENISSIVHKSIYFNNCKSDLKNVE